MSSIPEYITSIYQSFSAFDSVSGSSGTSNQTSGIIENFSGGKPWNPKCNDKNNIPFEKSDNGVVKYTGSVVKDTDTGFYYNIQPDFNQNAVLSLSQKMADYTFFNPYK